MQKKTLFCTCFIWEDEAKLVYWESWESVSRYVWFLVSFNFFTLLCGGFLYMKQNVHTVGGVPWAHYFLGLTALAGPTFGASSQEVLGSYRLFWWIAAHCVDILNLGILFSYCCLLSCSFLRTYKVDLSMMCPTLITNLWRAPALELWIGISVLLHWSSPFKES